MKEGFKKVLQRWVGVREDTGNYKACDIKGAIVTGERCYEPVHVQDAQMTDTAILAPLKTPFLSSPLLWYQSVLH